MMQLINALITNLNINTVQTGRINMLPFLVHLLCKVKHTGNDFNIKITSLHRTLNNLCDLNFAITS